MTDDFDLTAWNNGELCEHGEQWHADCKPAADGTPEWVYMTEGFSAAFHYRQYCTALASGQRKVVRSGVTAAPITRVRIGKAKAAAKFPCGICCKH